MNNIRIKDHADLEKDPNSGAVILRNTHTLTDLKIENVNRRVKIIEQQNKEILQLLHEIMDKISA